MNAAPGQPARPQRPLREVLRLVWQHLRRGPRQAVETFLGETIWRWNLKRLPPLQRLGALLLRVLYLAGRAFVSRRAQLQAMALTYTTMLALVPAFAIMLAVFSLGGLEDVRSRLQQFLFHAIAASPEQELTIGRYVSELADNVSSNRAGASLAFLVFLFLTVVALLSTLEKTLNQIWGIQRSRGFISKFITYWAIATLGPLIMGFALVQGSALTARLSQVTWWGQPEAAAPAPGDEEAGFAFGGAGGALVAEFEVQREQQQELSLTYFLTGYRTQGARGSAALTWVLTVVTFTLLYAFLPNTKVRLDAALLGALLAASLWLLTKWGLTLSSSTLVKYNTLYGSLATVPITMFWLYLTWLVVILGAELSFALQNSGGQRHEELAAETTTLCKEIVALRLCALVAHAFDRGAPPPTRATLAEQVGAPLSLCGALLYHLTEDGILREVETHDEEHGLIPARPLEAISLADVIDSLREKAGVAFDLTWGEDLPVLSEHLGRANAAFKALAGRTTLREVVGALERRLRSGRVLDPELAAVSVVTARAIAGAGVRPGSELPGVGSIAASSSDVVEAPPAPANGGPRPMADAPPADETPAAPSPPSADA